MKYSQINRSSISPTQLFILSFMFLILIGTVLLQLPISLNQDLSIIDALFTSTSAVCVTGLVVVNTSTHFTWFGQTVIMFLIQAGGLGILTFSTYFSYFFKGGSSYENQLATKDYMNAEKVGEVFTMLKRILLITFIVEAFGALMIYLSLDEKLIPHWEERIFFAVFHAISSFCNAGFSTLPNGLTEATYVHNYNLQLIIILLFVFGGLGFPIVINVLKYLKHLFNRFMMQLTKRRQDNYKARLLNINSKVNLITTFSLIVIATVILFFKEYNNTLASHEGFGKFITALFTATTPRTAGYNSINFSELHFSSTILIILLMWIGASPNSTGGGIKTSTFALAIFNFISLARGKDHIEVFQREISERTIRRAFAAMTLSLLVIGVGVFLITTFDPKLSLLDIAFECFSAYSTVGLTLGITEDLTTGSKLVIIIIMFIGRVTMLSILVSLFKKIKFTNYRYPTEEMTII
ncbi:TrkH family potassium uptake protein [Sphingobacterium faecium]|uniref:TrkH family potassium uptake protein n=1 Tax=Sphingobacterium faecium TaxID=34087 RepID=UPI003208D705